MSEFFDLLHELQQRQLDTDCFNRIIQPAWDQFTALASAYEEALAQCAEAVKVNSGPIAGRIGAFVASASPVRCDSMTAEDRFLAHFVGAILAYAEMQASCTITPTDAHFTVSYRGVELSTGELDPNENIAFVLNLAAQDLAGKHAEVARHFYVMKATLFYGRGDAAE